MASAIPNIARAVFGRGSAVRLVAGAAVLGLALFHAWLFWQRIATASLLEPAVALRWAGALLVLAAAGTLHRRGLLRGNARALIVLALVAALLHIAPPAEPGARAFVPGQILLAAATGAVALAAASSCAVSGPPLSLAAALHAPSARLFDAGLTGRPLDRGPPSRS